VTIDGGGGYVRIQGGQIARETNFEHPAVFLCGQIPTAEREQDQLLTEALAAIWN
jgi:hypothetical protein